MSIARQLYQLQAVDLELASNEQALKRLTSQLGESQEVVTTQEELSRESQRLEELRRQQHSIEWEIDDFTAKLAVVEEKLYGGRITNPKELANLQHEADGLKGRRNQAEDRVLEIMEQVLCRWRNNYCSSLQTRSLPSILRHVILIPIFCAHDVTI